MPRPTWLRCGAIQGDAAVAADHGPQPALALARIPATLQPALIRVVAGLDARASMLCGNMMMMIVA
jgi:hypothetical protein